MEHVIGVVLAVVVCVFAMLTGFDRDRVFYPTVLMTFGTYYVLFALIGGSTPALVAECLATGALAVLAVPGFKKNLWITAAALAGHGVFDFFHASLIHNPGVPAWWPGFCTSFDVVAAGILGVLLLRRPGFAAVVNQEVRLVSTHTAGRR